MYLDRGDLAKRGIPHSERRLEAIGQLPRRVKLSRSRVAWIEAEIEEWERARNAARAA